MKLALILFMFFANLVPTWLNVEETPDEAVYLEEKTEFENNARNAYYVYHIYKEEVNEDYVLEIILGSYKNELYYDVFFYNINTSYAVRFEIDGEEFGYNYQEDNGYIYYSINGIQNKQTTSIELYLFNGYAKTLTVKIPNDYTSYSSASGLNNGVIISYLEPVTGADKTTVLIIAASIAVIFICLIGIGIFFVIKMGKKTASPMGYQKNLPHVEFERDPYANPNPPEEQNNIKVQVMVDDELEDSNIKVNNQPKDNQTQSVYDKQIRYEDVNDEDIPEVDIESLLLMKGYKTDYSVMTEQEKNEVMVYLMVLRKTNQISLDQYSKEVIKLWKK